MIYENCKMLLFSLVTAFMLVLTLGIFLPEGALKAKAYGNITGFSEYSSGKYYKWDEYDGAASYKVEITSSKLNKTYTVTEPKFDYGDKFTQKGVMYNYSITACDKNGTALSRPLTGYEIEKDKITGVKISDDLTVSWDAFDGDNEEYTINIRLTSGGTGGTSAAKDQTSKNIAERIATEPSGRIELWVSAGVDIGYHVTTADSDTIGFDYVNPNICITSTKAAVAAPVPGTKPDYTVYFVINDGAVKADDCINEYSLQWVDVATDKLLNKDSVFEAGRRYRVTIWVGLNKGYYLDQETAKYKDMTSSINGISTYMYNTGGYTGYGFKVVFDPLTVIDTVNVTLTEPKAGEERLVDATTSTTGANVEARFYERRRWHLSKNCILWYKDGASFTGIYEKDNTYTAQIRLVTDDGYAITKDTKVYANGKPAAFDSFDVTGAAIFTINYDLRDRIPGDVNSDGKVDLTDVIVFKQSIAGWKVTINKSNADVNADTKADIKYVIILKQKLAGWKVTLK